MQTEREPTTSRPESLADAPRLSALHYHTCKLFDHSFCKIEYEHDPWEVALHALQYFDRPFVEWSNLQKLSAARLDNWLTQQHVQEDFTSVPADEISWCLEEIGKVFYLDRLNDVAFNWFDDTSIQHLKFESVGLAYKASDNDRKQTVAIDPLRRSRMPLSTKKIWQSSMGILLHESVHVYLARFAKDILMFPDGTTGTPGYLYEPAIVIPAMAHHSAWHVLAEAIERRAASELGWELDLGRQEGLFTEVNKAKFPLLSDSEFRHCFNDRPESSRLKEIYDTYCRDQPSKSDQYHKERHWKTAKIQWQVTRRQFGLSIRTHLSSKWWDP